MLSLSNFRKVLYAAFHEMAEHPEKAYKVYHRRKVYIISLLPTEERVTKPYKVQKPIIKNKSRVCKVCGSVEVNGLCLNVQCASVK